MLKFKSFLVSCIVFMAVPLMSAGAAVPDGFADLVEKLSPTVVNISTTENIKESSQPKIDPEIFNQFPQGSPFRELFKEFFDQQQIGSQVKPRQSMSLGSGFIIDAEQGYIVTNNHVIEDADEILVVLHDNTELKAQVIGRDSKTDLALLQVKTKHPLTAAIWGDSDAMRVGDWILTIGNPFGLGGTVTAGIVSARARNLSEDAYVDFIQTDASINMGNSGGPMFNTKGEVIGINTAIATPSGGSVGIGFAIPSQLAKSIIEQLKQYGKARRGFIGVKIQMVTPEIAESLGLSSPKGALVAALASNDTPAGKAGIEPGDVILKFDGKPIDTIKQLPRVIGQTEVNKKVPVEIWRKEKAMTIEVVVGELKEEGEQVQPIPMTEDQSKTIKADVIKELDLSVAPLTDQLRSQYQIGPDILGVIVTQVVPNGISAVKGIKPGDVIMEVRQEPVLTSKDIDKQIKLALKAGQKSILLLIDRQEELHFIALGIDPKAKKPTP